MIQNTQQSRITALAACVMLVLAAPVFADTIYTAILDGASSHTSSPATGTATLTLNTEETEVSYVIEFSGLEGSETGAHIHNGAPGEVGLRFLTLLPGSPKVGIWEVGPLEVVELNADRVYINIHTDVYPAGEIRGNVQFNIVANEAVSWGSVKALFK